MTDREKAVLEEMAHEDRRRTRRERLLIASILIIGLVLALVVGYELTVTDEGIRSVKCEQGDVILVLEKAGGEIERVECPAEVPIKP